MCKTLKSMLRNRSISVLMGLLFTVNLVGDSVFAQNNLPSFNCNTNLSVTERKICSSAELSALDRSMSQLYFQILPSLNSTDEQRFRLHQRDFLRERNSCRDAESCLFYQYQDRIQEIRNFDQKRSEEATGQRGVQTNTQFETQISINIDSTNSVPQSFDSNLNINSFPASGIGYGGNLRQGPGTQFTVTGRVSENEPLIIQRKTKVKMNGYYWYEVQSASGKSGYHWGGIMCNFFNRQDAFRCPPIR